LKILVIGAGGMLGHQVWLKVKKEFGDTQVGCTLRKSKSHYDQFHLFDTGFVFDGVELSNFKATEEILNSFKPDWIVNCVGLTLRKKELQDIEKCYEINSMLPHRLALWGLKNKARVIHFSTDCVFDGKKGSYSELDNPSADDAYGKSKFLGEIAYSNALTMRLSIVGRELEGKTELIEWLMSKKGQSASGYAHAIYSGLTTNEVASQVVQIVKKFPTLNGVYHVASEPISKYDLLKKVNDIYNLNVTITPNTDYKADKSLTCERYCQATGFVKPSWDQMIAEMKQEEMLSYET
jgi:dTDP-4-dehydrorhamnose reductase